MAKADLPGELATRYEWVAQLGRGAMGVVHRVRDRDLGREVALKLVSAQLLADPAKLRRFEREARVLARVRHPGVVQLFDFGVAEGQPYMAMELLEGEDLDEAAGGEPRAVVLEAAEALEAVHQAGVLHRDVKPANLMRLVDGRVVLVDFGLANANEESTITRSGDVVGSPYFMAPEVLCGQPATPASDFYSLGVTLYALLEGKAPFRPDMFRDYVLGQHELELAPRRVAPDGPEMAAVRACMAREPGERPTSRAALEGLLQGEAHGAAAHAETRSQVLPSGMAVPHPAPAPVPEPASPGRRLPWRALALAGALGLVLGGLAQRPEAPSEVLPTASPVPPREAAESTELRRNWGRWVESSQELADHLGLTREEVVDHLPALVEWTDVQRLADTLAEERFLLLLDVLRRQVGSWLAVAEDAPPAVARAHGPSSDPFPAELLRYLFRLTYEADLRMDMAILALVGQAGYTDGEHRLREDWGARKLSLRDLAGQVADGVARLENPGRVLERARLAAVAIDPSAPVGDIAGAMRVQLVDAPPTLPRVLDALALDMLGTQRFEARALACGDRAAIQETLLSFEERVRGAGPVTAPTLMLTGRLLENEIRVARLCRGRWSPVRRQVVDDLFRVLVDAGEHFPEVYAVILRDIHTTGRGNVPVFHEAPPDLVDLIDEVARRVEAIPGQGPVKVFSLGDL